MIRNLKKMDEDFIYHSWLHSVKCPTRAVSTMTRFLIDSLVQEQEGLNSGIKVWCPDDDTNHILGWIAYGKIEKANLLHYVFVKKKFRQNHIGKELLYSVYPDRDVQTFCTYWSHHMQQMDARKRWNTKFVANLLPAKIHELHEQHRLALDIYSHTISALEEINGAA